jgi:hypothetical protein
MPFADAAFVLVICLGVIQHTPCPETTIARLLAQVGQAGTLVIDHYRPSLAHYTKVTALMLRPILKRLPPATGSAVCARLVNALFPLHRAVRGRLVAQALLSRVSPLMTCHRAYPELNDTLQYEWAMLETNDSLTDFYKHFRTVAQIREALTQLGATDIHVVRGGNGVEARCRPGRDHESVLEPVS